MKKTKNKQFLIPEGHFESNCHSCFYAKSDGMEDDESVLCKNDNGRRKYIYDMAGCPHYKPRIRTWLKIIAMSYILITVFVIIIENFL